MCEGPGYQPVLRRALLVFVALIFVFALFGCVAPTQGPEFTCGLSDDIRQRYIKTWNEFPVGVSSHSETDDVYVLFANPAGTWTVLWRKDAEHLCVVTYGRLLMPSGSPVVLRERPQWRKMNWP